jgi:hypothetical protein
MTHNNAGPWTASLELGSIRNGTQVGPRRELEPRPRARAWR